MKPNGQITIVWENRGEKAVQKKGEKLEKPRNQKPPKKNQKADGEEPTG